MAGVCSECLHEVLNSLRTWLSTVCIYSVEVSVCSHCKDILVGNCTVPKVMCLQHCLDHEAFPGAEATIQVRIQCRWFDPLA